MAGVSYNHSTPSNLESQLTQASDDASQAHQDVYGQDGSQPDNQASFTHEALAGAAGFEAMRKYQQHEQANGTLTHPPLSHPLSYSLAPSLTPCLSILYLHPTTTMLTPFAKTGVAENHTFAKDLLAGFAGGEADKLVETKGEDFYDREKLKRDAQNNASDYYDQQYQGGGGQGGGNQGGGDSGYGGNQGGDSGYGGNQGGDSGY